MDYLLIYFLLAGVVLFWKWRREVAAFSETLVLKEVSASTWHHADQIRCFAKAFTKVDFTFLAIYGCPQRPGVFFWVFAHRNGTVAVICDRAESCKVEFILAYEDGSRLTVTNNDMGLGTSAKLWHERHYAARASASQLWQLLNRRRSMHKLPLHFDRWSFPKYIKRSFRESTRPTRRQQAYRPKAQVPG